MSRKKGRGYPRDFRLNAARYVVEGGYTYSKAAERLGVSTESLRRWIKAFRSSGDIPSEQSETSSRVRELQREVSELRIENEILTATALRRWVRSATKVA